NDAQSNLNPIEPIGYQNLINDQVIYARVFENAECYVIIEVILNVNAASDLGIHDAIDICVEDISETVLIEYAQVHEALEADFPGSEVKIYYNINDAHLDLNPIQEDFIIENTNAIALYFRVENSNFCDYIGSVLLNVLAAPVAEDQTIVFCHGTEIILDAGSGYDHYLWSTGATTQSLTIEVPGTYWVEISNGLGCTSSFEFEVSESLDFEITDIEIRDFQVQNSVYIQIDNTDGLIEYSLDGIAYFESAYFTAVQPGIYEVHVRKDNCNIATQTVLVGGFPNYFTPNGDGIHDLWQIKRPGFFENAIIEIYDRYGKLLKTMTTASEGWNGTFNGQLMNPDDYWFIIRFNDRIVKGHFALKL
ncbi:MAG: T9SS type B sorting domain-containing protein, partial [Flavobacteriaceae bacterium]|nr:T9SS type B sorting domain-containing protein [Flavobacteriaceae bacterium]